MKNFSIALFLFFGSQLLEFNNNLSAQTTVSIVMHHENLSQTCVVPADWNFWVSAEMEYYSSLDSATFFVDFGDSHDTTLTAPLYFYDAIHSNSNTGSYLSHTYTAAGNYPVVYIVTLPDGNADTLNFNAMVNPTCNNVTGRLYIDANSDCIYNSGDIPIPNVSVGIDHNGTNVSYDYTDAQGLYVLSACPGYSYSLLTDTTGFSGLKFNLTCSTFNGMIINPSPNAVQDLITDGSPTVNIGDYPDSTNFTFGNCAPFTTYLNFFGSTVGLISPNDSLDLYINFGDGDDSTIKVPANGSGPAQIGSFWNNFSHTYNAAGNYDVEYIATGPNGISDTVVKLNKVRVVDTCGNVQGRLYVDNNNNCIYDAGDSATANVFVQLTYTASGFTHYAFTDLNGHYSFDVLPGNYLISVLPGTNNTVPLTPTCPASGTINVIITASNSVTENFALICNSNHQLTGGYSLWPGIFSTYHTHIGIWDLNYSCMPIADTVQFILDPLVHYVGLCDTTFLPAINGDTLTWTFNSNSYSYNNWYFWMRYVGCVEVTGDPSLQLGDTVCFTLIIKPIAGDIYPSDNIITRCIPALVSIDPNTKEVFPQGSGPLGYVPEGTKFDYKINFQNTGTAAARNIFVLDTLDSDLDLSTLMITGSDHQMIPQFLPGNVIKFNFTDINLPDSTSDEPHSHGWVSYSIKAKPFLPNLTPIKNTAGIYFDFNPPVITNTTLNTIYDPSSVPEIVGNDAIIFPNPASSSVEIKFSSETNGVYTITDLAGKKVFDGKLQGLSTHIDTSALQDGVYFIVMETVNGKSTQKIIVQH